MDAWLVQLREAAGSGHPHRCPDALVCALDGLYDLVEAWAIGRDIRKKTDRQNDDVKEDSAARTALALAYARGRKTHYLLTRDFGELTDAYVDAYTDVYGAWCWQAELPGVQRRVACAQVGVRADSVWSRAGAGVRGLD